MKILSPDDALRWPGIAIIGCGAITESYYLPALTKYPSLLERIVLADVDGDRARALADRFHVRAHTTDYRSVLGEVRGAVVAVPHHLHHGITKDLLAAGVHVLCEKPLAETAREAEEMISAAEGSGVTLSVNNVRRLFPSSVKVKELIEAGEVGAVRSIQYFDGARFNWPTASGFYFNSGLSKKGVLLDIGAHVLDLICWWLGTPPRLVSCEHDSFGGPEAAVSVVLDHGGHRSDVRLSRLAKLPNRYRISGEAGCIEGEVYDWTRLSVTDATGRRREVRTSGRYAGLSDLGVILIGNFLEVLRGTAAPLIPGRAVLPSLRLLDEAYARATKFAMPWYDVSAAPSEY